MILKDLSAMRRKILQDFFHRRRKSGRESQTGGREARRQPAARRLLVCTRHEEPFHISIRVRLAIRRHAL